MSSANNHLGSCVQIVVLCQQIPQNNITRKRCENMYHMTFGKKVIDWQFQISMLYSSVYNLFALIGRKAPFTHSNINVLIMWLIAWFHFGDQDNKSNRRDLYP